MNQEDEQAILGLKQNLDLALRQRRRAIDEAVVGTPQQQAIIDKVSLDLLRYKFAVMKLGVTDTQARQDNIDLLSKNGFTAAGKGEPVLSNITSLATQLARHLDKLPVEERKQDPKAQDLSTVLQSGVEVFRQQQLQLGVSDGEIQAQIDGVIAQVKDVLMPTTDNRLQTEVKTAMPAIDYQAIANGLPLDEKNPPQPDSFIQPIVTNLFAEDDTATLAGRIIPDAYSNLVKRANIERYKEGEVQHLLETSKETRQAFIKNIEEINKKRQENGLPPLDLGIMRQSGKDGFHFDGESRNSKDFLFYFGKSSANYKNRGEPEVRAYVTIKPELRVDNQRYFTDLAMRLYDAGIDFSAKAASIFGVTQRTDNMVFYISLTDQPKASQIIKDFLKETNIGQGKMLAGLPSPQEGLSWAMQPDEAQMEIWKKISGSSENTSFNVLVATMAMPAYLDRLVAAHRKNGDIKAAQVFEAEAKRVRKILSNS